MRPSDNDSGYWLGWLFAYALLGTVFAGLVLYGQFDKLCHSPTPAWIPWPQAEEHCFRDWLAALSGWVGFGAAAIGAYFVYHQLSEQRKQTAFILGDGEPTIEVYRSAKISKSRRTSRSGIVRIVNWNRRSVYICAARVTIPQGVVELSQMYGAAVTVPTQSPSSIRIIEPDGKIRNRPIIPGWLNRQDTPPYRDFFFIFYGKPNRAVRAIASDWTVNLEIDFFHSDSRAKIETLTMEVPFKQFLPSGAIKL